MGNLLQVMGSGKKGGDADIFIDFENSRPTEAEQAVFDQVNAIMERTSGVLGQLEAYRGAGDAIRLAIGNPKDEAQQQAAWDAVCPLVMQLKGFYDFSAEVEGVVPQLMAALCTDAPQVALGAAQALAKQAAELLNFVLKFDDLKMNNPAIQNDFSYYRRTLSRMKINQNEGGDDGGIGGAVVSNEDANRMSLFYAYPQPMLKCLCEATTRFSADHSEIPAEHCTGVLATMSTICRIMIETPVYHERFTNPETIFFCQRVMVAAVIVYDHVHPQGAFFKKNSEIDMIRTIKAVRMHSNPATDPLLNALRYSSKHLNGEDTPKKVKELLA